MSMSEMETCSFIKKALCKIKSRQWTAPIGIALTHTASILEDVGDFKPLEAVLGGALAIGSLLLNCECTLQDDLKQEKQELEGAKSNFAGSVGKALEWRLVDIQSKLTDPHQETIGNFNFLQSALQSEFKEISVKMTLLEKDISEINHAMKNVFEAINDPDFMYAFKMVDSSYRSFINGSYNLSHYFSTITYYVFHLQSQISKTLNPIEIQGHLSLIYVMHGADICDQMLSYVILMLSKYLQLISAYFLCKTQDPERVVFEFERFNDYCYKFFITYESLIGSNCHEERRRSFENVYKEKKAQSKKNFLPDVAHCSRYRSMFDVIKLLDEIGLPHLIPIFYSEKITLNVLLRLNDSDLENGGILNVEDRAKILQAVTWLKQTGVSEGKSISNTGTLITLPEGDDDGEMITAQTSLQKPNAQTNIRTSTEEGDDCEMNAAQICLQKLDTQTTKASSEEGDKSQMETSQVSLQKSNTQTIRISTEEGDDCEINAAQICLQKLDTQTTKTSHEEGNKSQMEISQVSLEKPSTQTSVTSPERDKDELKTAQISLQSFYEGADAVLNKLRAGKSKDGKDTSARGITYDCEHLDRLIRELEVGITATAVRDFTATTHNEISFVSNDRIDNIDMQKDG